MIPVPVSLDYVRQLDPDRIAVFDYSGDIAWRVRHAGFGFVIVEGSGQKKIMAVGRKNDLVYRSKQWNTPFTSRLDFEPEKASTAGGWFARRGRSQ